MQRKKECELLCVVSRSQLLNRSEGLGDGDREVGEPSVLGFWGSKIGLGTTKEGLGLETAETALSTAPELEPTNADDAVSVEEELQLSVGLTNIVKTNTLRHSVPLARFEVKGTPTDGSTISGVAFRFGGNVAQFAVSLEARVLG